MSHLQQEQRLRKLEHIAATIQAVTLSVRALLLLRICCCGIDLLLLGKLLSRPVVQRRSTIVSDARSQSAQELRTHTHTQSVNSDVGLELESWVRANPGWCDL